MEVIIYNDPTFDEVKSSIDISNDTFLGLNQNEIAISMNFKEESPLQVTTNQTEKSVLDRFKYKNEVFNYTDEPDNPSFIFVVHHLWILTNFHQNVDFPLINNLVNSFNRANNLESSFSNKYKAQRKHSDISSNKIGIMLTKNSMPIFAIESYLNKKLITISSRECSLGIKELELINFIINEIYQ